MAVSQKDFIKWLSEKYRASICQSTSSCTHCDYSSKNNKFQKPCSNLTQKDLVELTKDKFEQELLKEVEEKNE